MAALDFAAIVARAHTVDEIARESHAIAQHGWPGAIAAPTDEHTVPSAYAHR